MTNWIEYEPAVGWSAFDRNDAFTKALHAQLPESDWHYQWQYRNFVEVSELWESLRDASNMVTHLNINQFVDERFVYLATQGAAATAIVDSLAVEFGLVRSVRFEPYDAGRRCTARLAPTRPSQDSAARRDGNRWTRTSAHTSACAPDGSAVASSELVRRVQM